MLVIEGYQGKSLEVAKYIDTLENQTVLVITNDESSLNMLNQTKNSVYIAEQSDVEDMKDIIKSAIKLNNKFKHVIFHQNVKKEDIYVYKNIEQRFNLQSVLTVQTHDRENPREIAKYTV